MIKKTVKIAISDFYCDFLNIVNIFFMIFETHTLKKKKERKMEKYHKK